MVSGYGRRSQGVLLFFEVEWAQLLEARYADGWAHGEGTKAGRSDDEDYGRGNEMFRKESS